MIFSFWGLAPVSLMAIDVACIPLKCRYPKSDDELEEAVGR